MAMGLPDSAPRAAPSDRDANFIPDEVLVRRLVDGSESSLAELYDRHSATVYAAALRVGRDPGTAADVVQETFLALWDRAELFDASLGSLRAWLHTIARNRAVDRLRSSRRHDRATSFSSFAGSSEGENDGSLAEWLVASGSPVAMAGAEPSPETAVRDRETRRSLAAALATLEPNEREVIELAYAAGLSQSEVAERLGWPLGTVKTRTRRALRRLREHLEATGMQSA